MVQVYASSVIDASADSVWSRIRDFNALPEWHPAIADSRIENGQPSDRVGCIRHFHLRDGGMIREKLLALSDYDLEAHAGDGWWAVLCGVECGVRVCADS